MIFATGSHTWVPPIDNLTQDSPNTGILKPGAFRFRTIEDCDQMLAWARNVGHVLEAINPATPNQFATDVASA